MSTNYEKNFCIKYKSLETTVPEVKTNYQETLLHYQKHN